MNEAAQWKQVNFLTDSGQEEHSNSWGKCWNVTFSCWSSVLLRLGSVCVVHLAIEHIGRFLRIWIPQNTTMANLQNVFFGRLFPLAVSGSCSSWNHPTVGNFLAWSRHMEQHSLEESTWSNEYLGLFRRERGRRRSACSEFGIKSLLSHRKLPIQAVTYSGWRMVQTSKTDHFGCAQQKWCNLNLQHAMVLKFSENQQKLLFFLNT